MKSTVTGFRFNLHSLDTSSSGSDPKKNAAESVGKNDDLFKSLANIEDQVDAIVSGSAKKYIDGIKQNVLDMIMHWLETGNERFFFLFGNMGTGKSFFSAKLFTTVKHAADIYPPVIYSSQQTYSATANIENMLLVTAARLCRSVPEYAEYFKNNELGEKDIEKLAEKVLIEPFERISPAKKVFIIIDGLDEYPKRECTMLLDAITRMTPRMSRLLHIFFSSRPERYIRSHLPSHSPEAEYMIENQEADSRSDCLAFIRAKSDELGLEMSADVENLLIKKSKYCIKYLQCIFDDSQTVSMLIEDNMIDKLPNGLLSFYREQLIRYFTDERAYREDFLPLLEVICAAYRPLTVFELADILGCDSDRISNLILRAGTLIYKSENLVYLYQSESIKSYLSDERNCPENFLVQPENGRRRILARISELIDDEDLDSNDYLLFFAADHILDLAEKNDNKAWELLYNLISANVDQRDIMNDLCQTVLEKNQGTWKKFIQKLYKSPILDPIQKDNIASILYNKAKAKNLTPALIDVVSGLHSLIDFRYYELLLRVRHAKNIDAYDAALEHAAQALEVIDSCSITDQLRNMRYSYIYDEIQRILKYSGGSISKIVEYMAKLFESSELALASCKPHDRIYAILMRNHSVSYDQLGRLFEKLFSLSLSSNERQEIAERLCAVLHTSSAGADNSDFFIRQAIYCHKKSLEIVKRLQTLDSNSKFRLYDLTFSLSALGKLYAKGNFRGRDTGMAIKYLEDSLSICEKISQRAFLEATDTHPLDMKYARAPLSTLDKLIDLYKDEKNAAMCCEYISKKKSLAELLCGRYPSEENHFSVVVTYEDEAYIKCDTEGIHAAKDMYIKVAEMYTAGAEEWKSERFIRAPGIVFGNLALSLEKIGEYNEAVVYRRKALEIYRSAYEEYPTHNNRFYMILDMEHLANALLNTKDSACANEAVSLLIDAISKYRELAAIHPTENYDRAPLSVFNRLWEYYVDIGSYDTALQYAKQAKELASDLLERYKNSRSASNLAIVIFHKSKILLKLSNAEQAEKRILELAGICENLYMQWESKDIIDIIMFIYDNLGDGFSKSNNSAKVLLYRKFAAEISAKISDEFQSERSLLNRCQYTKWYADALMDTKNPDDIEAAIRIYKQVIERYVILTEKYQNPLYVQNRLSIYSNLISHYCKIEQYDEAKEYIAMTKAGEEYLRGTAITEYNDFSINTAYEYEAIIADTCGETSKAAQLYNELIERYTEQAFKWKSEQSVRCVFRAYAKAINLHKNDKASQALASLIYNRITFINKLYENDIDKVCQELLGDHTFNESVTAGDLLMEYNDDAATIIAVESYGLAISIGLSSKNGDSDNSQRVYSVIKKLETAFAQTKLSIKFLYNQGNPENKERLLVYLKIALKIISIFECCTSDTSFENKYSKLQNEYMRIAESLK